MNGEPLDRPPAEPYEQPGDIRVMVRVLQPGSASRRARAILREVLQDTGLDDDAISDAELAANAEKHARPPYELRVISVDAVPTWCEISDGDPDLYEIGLIFNLLHSVDEIGLPLLAENGRGLLLAHRLSHGHCHVHATTTLTTGTPANNEWHKNPRTCLHKTRGTPITSALT
ncbi:ATP-binding protein [Streptosporangium amethystogenes]|uniref:ATP-binding protein n=1 Tax=Streptosporangium amethystogenes TaxID=2002 RepID=UPI00378D0DDD